MKLTTISLLVLSCSLNAFAQVPYGGPISVVPVGANQSQVDTSVSNYFIANPVTTSQTPWTGNINAAGHVLNNASYVNVSQANPGGYQIGSQWVIDWNNNLTNIRSGSINNDLVVGGKVAASAFVGISLTNPVIKSTGTSASIINLETNADFLVQDKLGSNIFQLKHNSVNKWFFYIGDHLQDNNRIKDVEIYLEEALFFDVFEHANPIYFGLVGYHTGEQDRPGTDQDSTLSITNKYPFCEVLGDRSYGHPLASNYRLYCYDGGFFPVHIESQNQWDRIDQDTYNPIVTTITNGAAIGSGGSPSASLDSQATDVAFNLSVHTGSSSLVASNIVTVWYGRSYALVPHIVFSPTSQTAVTNQCYISSGTVSNFQFKCATPLAASTTYSWDFQVIQ